MKFITKIVLSLTVLMLGACKDDVDTIPTDQKYEYFIKSLVVSPAEEYLLHGADQLKILSLNNSLIDYNEMPTVFNRLAEAGGKNAVWEKQTRLGQSLQTHYDEGDQMVSPGMPTAKYRIRSEPWTHIILQEQSAKPLTNPEGFLSSVKQWVEYIREYCPNPEARVVLMLNWPLRTSSNYSQDMETLYATDQEVAAKTGTLIFPVAHAYNIIFEEEGKDARNELYTDDRHPSVKATYMGACVFYNCFFNESPVELSYYPGELSASEAQQMQTRAAEAAATHHIASDYSSQLRFRYDQMSPNGERLGVDEFPIQWSVSGGGTIDSDGVFHSDGTEGVFTVTATTTESHSAEAKITVRKTGSGGDDEYAGIEPGATYTQDFNSIGTGDEATLPTGWKIEKMIGATSQRTLGIYSAAGKATEMSAAENIASNATNGLYNFGPSSNSQDRAVGGITTGDTEKTQGVNVYLHLVNTGTARINSLDVSFNIEKYRKGNNTAGFTAQMYCSPDGVNWTPAGDDFTVSFAPDSETGGYSVVPGDTRAVSGTLYENLAAGASLYLGWNFSVSSGTTSSGAQALALDDVRITASSQEDADYIPVSTATYTQDFDAIGTSATATLPQGWRIEKRLDAPRVLGTFATAGNCTEQVGGINMSSTARNGIYNFGAGDESTATDRAIGGLSTGVNDGTRGVNIYSRYRNTGNAVKTVSVAYDVEKYRNGNNEQGFRIQLYYSRDGRSWTLAGDDFRTYFSPDGDMNGLAEVPSETRPVSGVLNIELEQNEDLYLAWNYSVNIGTACQGAMGLGIDNVAVTFNR